MNNPFDYIPSEQMLGEQHVLVEQIERLRHKDASFREDVDKGKMFGILITDSDVLYAFSGQIGGSFNWPGFVPAVYDYLDENGYFKVHEREISALNHRICDLENSHTLEDLRSRYEALCRQSDDDISLYRQQMKVAKALRDERRAEGGATEDECIRESQFMKAELHRKKLYWREQLSNVKNEIDCIEGDIRLLKLQRQQKSDRLQRWLFEQFEFQTSNGNTINLLEIFQSYPSPSLKGRTGEGLPPSGSGECCEPKLLHYALEHKLEPIEIGMFWWGESPKQEVRHHLHFYPACSGKCKPILEVLRGGFLVESGERRRDRGGLEILFEDEHLIVVNKPSGMLSVPGKEDGESVYSILKASHSDCVELAMVHRLDMDTSGLLVVAKTKAVHKDLQRQFAERCIEKEYMAILEKPLATDEGTISLPLRPDYDDRPRQMVDRENGKPAITKYKAINSRLLVGDGLGGRLVSLVPHTGRTHQLRVHCAHKDGLNNPIKGDRLYGSKADRLYLHAAKLTLTHPVTKERMTFESLEGSVRERSEG